MPVCGQLKNLRWTCCDKALGQCFALAELWVTLSGVEGDRDWDEGHPNPIAGSTETEAVSAAVAHAPSTSLSLSGLIGPAAPQHVAAIAIGQGEWVAPTSIPQSKVAFEVSAPQVVRCIARQWSSFPSSRRQTAPLRSNQTPPIQDQADRALRRELPAPERRQQHNQLLRSPQVLSPQIDDQILQLQRQPTWMQGRPEAVFLKRRPTHLRHAEYCHS